MSKSPWFRCFPSNFLLGTAGMRPILFKTYTRLLMGMYELGGPLPMKLAPLARLLELRQQDVGRLVGELVGLGKLKVVDGFIHNLRTDRELRQLSPTNGLPYGVGEAPPTPQVEPHQGVRSGEKPNGNYTRAHDHTRAHPARAPTSKQVKSGARPVLKAERAALSTLEVSATAPEARKENGSGNGDNLPRRRTSEWDMEPAPGPIGQTPFLKKFAAAKAGDLHALEPLQGIPWASSNPVLSAKIRTQLGLSLPEDNNETDPPADQDDHGFDQRYERTPYLGGSEADQAGPRDGDAEAPPADLAAKHANPRKPNDESRPSMKDGPDEDFGGLP